MSLDCSRFTYIKSIMTMLNLATNRTILLLTGTRDENRLMRAVMDVNENLYESEIMADDRIVMTTVRNSNDEILRYELEGSPLDFFQIGLRYGKAEERNRILDSVILK